MKKVVFALVLAAAAAMTVAPCLYAQSSITIKDPAEYNEYTNAIGQATPQAKAAAIETFLMHYPQSVVYNDMLEQLVLAYSAFDPAKTIDAANRIHYLGRNGVQQCGLSAAHIVSQSLAPTLVVASCVILVSSGFLIACLAHGHRFLYIPGTQDVRQRAKHSF